MIGKSKRGREAHYGHMAAVTAAIAGTPVAVLLVLWIAGFLGQTPALAGMALCLAVAVGLAWVWMHDLNLLAETLRYAALENAPALSAAAASPLLLPIERVTRNIERLSRTLASRAAMVGQLLQTNETIVERLPDPLLVLGADRSVRRANAAARIAFGADIAAVLRHPDLRAAIDRAYAQQTSQSAEFELPVPIPREVAATIIFMDPPLADGGRAIAVLSDRTRERAVERMRADFVANASHELRTPLASLMGFITTLQGPASDDPPAQSRFLAIMAEQAERMNRLIDDLLSLSRIELTEHQAPAERVELAGIVESVAAGFEPRVAARQVVLELHLSDGLPTVTADADQMAQVVTNLVENAVKYGGAGGVVRVSLAVATPGAGGNARWPARPGVVLSVADNGPGIAREHVPRLTERFYRVDKGRSRNAGGTGLGLSIVKHIVNRHRGHLTIESEEGRGTVFSVWLPTGPEKTGGD